MLGAVAIPVFLLLSALAALAAASAGARSAPLAQEGGLIVRTADGLLRGKHAEGVDQFLGVPYAAPPVGPLRWQAPQPAQPWAGVRNATAYGNRCPQLASQDGPRADTENCLFLNVFAPLGPAGGSASGRAASRGGGLPVLFWIHGGVLVHGESDMYDGSLIARTDHIVVVSINYRLGAFGFLDVPGLGTSPLTASGNYGLLDQESALRWVHANIAAFGGSPHRVTIAGQSAGGWSVCALLASPPAVGLFAGAIMESGSCVSRTRAQAHAIGLEYADKVGCADPATTPACLRATPEKTLLTGTEGANSSPPALDVGFTSGGPDLPVPPAQAIATGHYDHVPILLGTNHDEARYFTQGFATASRQQYDQEITGLFGSLAPAILARYPWSSYPSSYTAAYALAAVFTDSGYVYGIGGCAEQNLAAQFAATSRTFFDQFDDENAPAQNGDLPGFQWGAAHGEELGFLWSSFDPWGTELYDLLTPAGLQLSAQMIAWWGAFAWHGAPDAPGQPAWPEYTSGQLMSLRPGGQSQTITAATFATEHQCAFWDAHPFAPGQTPTTSRPPG